MTVIEAIMMVMAFESRPVPEIRRCSCMFLPQRIFLLWSGAQLGSVCGKEYQLTISNPNRDPGGWACRTPAPPPPT
jgi:hypothetical protein